MLAVCRRFASFLLGSEFEKKGSEEKAGKPAANCQHISSRSLGKARSRKD